MMEALTIDKLRPGADGMNANAANAANCDESTVKALTPPDLLVCEDATKLATHEDW
jgi:hypothetical protein